MRLVPGLEGKALGELIVRLKASMPDFEAWVLATPQEEIDATVRAFAVGGEGTVIACAPWRSVPPGGSASDGGAIELTARTSAIFIRLLVAEIAVPLYGEELGA
jgi:hypothetical protein